MRPVNRPNKFNADGNPLEYNHWREAKEDLVILLGAFCSFCEKSVSRASLAVEHICPKGYTDSNGNKPYETLQYQWNNFLLACNNCNSVKGIKDTVALNPYLPHLDNLLCFIDILESGSIEIKTGLKTEEYNRTLAFIELVGLDRKPGDSNFSKYDDRWEERMDTYEKAVNALQKYESNPPTTDLVNIRDLAVSTGFFSVWFSVFYAYKEVKELLIENFRGTDRQRFDAKRGCLPI